VTWKFTGWGSGSRRGRKFPRRRILHASAAKSRRSISVEQGETHKKGRVLFFFLWFVLMLRAQHGTPHSGILPLPPVLGPFRSHGSITAKPETGDDRRNTSMMKPVWDSKPFRGLLPNVGMAAGDGAHWKRDITCSRISKIGQVEDIFPALRRIVIPLATILLSARIFHPNG